MLRILATALFVLFVFHGHARAQQAEVVDECGVLPNQLDLGKAKPVYQDKNGLQCFKPSAAPGSPPPYTLAPSTSPSIALTHPVTTALGASLVAKASAGNLYGFNCKGITGGATGYCVAVNASSVPATGALTDVLDACSFGANQDGCSFSRIPMSVNYSNGIVVLITIASSPLIYTAGATGFITVDLK